VANTDFVVDRIRSRLNEANTANLPSEKQSYFYDFLHSTSNDIPEHVVLLACEFVIVLWLLVRDVPDIWLYLVPPGYPATFHYPVLVLFPDSQETG